MPDKDYSAYFDRLIRDRGDQVTRPLQAILGPDKPIAPGVSQRRLAAWDLDFNHLPIGLLSETYEQMMARFDEDARRDTSVYYTPAHIAEYMVQEVMHRLPAGATARVVDPACGAGVFLVACFRKLAELYFSETGQRPTRAVLRGILEGQLTGFDTNPHAGTLAALALYLTALDLDPDPTPVEDLAFNKLEGSVLIDVADPGSEPSAIEPMVGSLGAHVSDGYRDKFDLVIGNPPWTSLPSRYAARQAIFRALAVTGILNGASLRKTTVWPNMDQPFCLLFADNRVPLENDRFVLASPEWDEALNDKGRMRIDACDAEPVDLDLAIRDRFVIKALYRGTAVDVAIVRRVQGEAITTIGKYWDKTQGLVSGQGFRIADRSGDDMFLLGFPTLQAGYSKHPFRVLPSSLFPYKPQGLHRPRDPRIYEAPLILVRKGSRAARERGRALLSTSDVAYSESYYGYSAARHPDGDFLVRYTLALVHSLLFEYATLGSSGEFGIEREALQILDIGRFPFISPESLDQAQRDAIRACAAQLLTNQPDWQALDQTISGLYGLSKLDQEVIADTLATRSPFPESRDHAASPATPAEKERFRARLQTELGKVLAAGGHRVTVVSLDPPSNDLPWGLLGVSLNGRHLPPELPSHWINAIDDLSASRITVVDAKEPCLVVGLLDRYRYWTSTRARLLASDLLWQHGALLEERARR